MNKIKIDTKLSLPIIDSPQGSISIGIKNALNIIINNNNNNNIDSSSSNNNNNMNININTNEYSPPPLLICGTAFMMSEARATLGITEPRDSVTLASLLSADTTVGTTSTSTGSSDSREKLSIYKDSQEYFSTSSTTTTSSSTTHS